MAYRPELLPTLADILAGSAGGLGFSVSHAPEPVEGWAELLVNGLTFDVHGLREGPAQPAPLIASTLGLDRNELDSLRWLTVAPGPHLAGAGHLLPVVRVVAMLVLELSKIGPASGISWIPAHLVLNCDLFERAVQPWLSGGPFPAPAFVAMRQDADGGLSSSGLKFLMGQEFVLQGGGRTESAHLRRIAVRLVDWLIANGPVTASTKAILAGTGEVVLESDNGARILARCN